MGQGRPEIVIILSPPPPPGGSRGESRISAGRDPGQAPDGVVSLPQKDKRGFPRGTWSCFLPLLPLCAALLFAIAPQGAIATEQEASETRENSVEKVVSSIDQFEDDPPIPPDHWALQHLSELVSKHKCVAGFRNRVTNIRTFRGEQPATRYEMAAILSYCLKSSSDPLLARIEDLEKSEKSYKNYYNNTYLYYSFSIAFVISLAGLTFKFTFNTLANSLNKQNKSVQVIAYLLLVALGSLPSLGVAYLSNPFRNNNSQDNSIRSESAEGAWLAQALQPGAVHSKEKLPEDNSIALLSLQSNEMITIGNLRGPPEHHCS